MSGADPVEGPVEDSSDRTVLAGRYRLDERIGVGAMGEVWRARDLRLERDVAVKRVRLDGHVEAAAQARFRREAVAMAGVSHPNVVSVYDSGTDEGDGVVTGPTAYLVMALLDGPSCADLVRAGRSLSLGEVERIGAGVARGLAAAHAAGVVHRDIKPSNVVLDRGVATIVDFGIARLEHETTSTLTAPQTTIGTAAYMSPEQALGRPVGPPSDVYSLGALLVALASGAPPFGAANSLALMRAHIDDAPPPLADLRDDAPPRLVELVDRMLAKTPAERPTASEVAHVLEGGSPPTEVQAAAGAVPPATATRVLPPPTRAYAPAAPVAAVASAGSPVPGTPRTPPGPGGARPARRGGGLWWLVAAAALVLALVVGANALRGPGDDGADADGTAAPTSTPTTSIVTSVVTPTQEATTEPVAPPPPPEDSDGDGDGDDEGSAGDLAAAVSAVEASISAVADDKARESLTKAWQSAGSGLQGANAAEKLRELQREADKLLEKDEVTAAERDAVSGAVEDLIGLL